MAYTEDRLAVLGERHVALMLGIFVVFVAIPHARGHGVLGKVDGIPV